MRHLYLLLLLIGLNGFSQSYTPFPMENASWIESYFGMQTKCGYSNFYTTGDTVINNLTYHKVTEYFHYTMSDFNGNCNGALNEGHTYRGSYRNDSLNKKVFWISSNNTNEILLYDFNLQIGDTIPYNPTFGVAVVTDIDSIQVNSIYHKRYKIDSCQTGWYYDNNYIIEGIGSSRGLIYGNNCPFEQFHDLVCFGINSNYVNLDPDPSSGTSCSFLATPMSKKQSEIKLFPNPAHSEININLGTTILSSISIIDLSGRTLKEIKTSGKSHVIIDINHLSKGCYIFQLVEESGSIQNVRIIKQ